MPGRRKLIALMSLELLLYSAAYFLCLLTAFMNMNAASGTLGFLFMAGLVLGLPMFVVVMNVSRVVRMKKAAAERPERAAIVSLATKLVIAQSLLVMLTTMAGALALGLCVALALAGLVVAAGLRDDVPPT